MSSESNTCYYFSYAPTGPRSGCGQNGCGSGGSYSAPLLPAPASVGASTSYIPERLGYDSGVRPQYGGSNVGALYQTSRDSPPDGGSLYQVRGKTEGGSVLPANIALPPQLPIPLPKQYAYKDGSMQSASAAAVNDQGEKNSLQYQQSENAYEELASDHDEQQRQQRTGGGIEKSEGTQVITDQVSEKTGGDEQTSDRVEINEVLHKEKQVATQKNAAFQGELSLQQSANAVATAAQASLQSASSEYSSIESSRIDAKNDKAVGNAIAGFEESEGNAIAESKSTETDDSCNDAILKAIIASTLKEHRDNLEAARKIESKASKEFGGRFNSIVSDSEFAYVNWYGKRNCQLQIDGRHSLTWED